MDKEYITYLGKNNTQTNEYYQINSNSCLLGIGEGEIQSKVLNHPSVNNIMFGIYCLTDIEVVTNTAGTVDLLEGLKELSFYNTDNHSKEKTTKQKTISTVSESLKEKKFYKDIIKIEEYAYFIQTGIVLGQKSGRKIWHNYSLFDNRLEACTITKPTDKVKPNRKSRRNGRLISTKEQMVDFIFDGYNVRGEDDSYGRKTYQIKFTGDFGFENGRYIL